MKRMLLLQSLPQSFLKMMNSCNSKLANDKCSQSSPIVIASCNLLLVSNPALDYWLLLQTCREKQNIPPTTSSETAPTQNGWSLICASTVNDSFWTYQTLRAVSGSDDRNSGFEDYWPSACIFPDSSFSFSGENLWSDALLLHVVPMCEQDFEKK